MLGLEAILRQKQFQNNMNTYIVLLKGINVGGHKKVPMVELRTLLTANGFLNVKTYIQSGNVVIESLEKEIHVIENKIQMLLLEHFGFDVSVLIITPNNLKQIFDGCPFDEEKKKASYFMMLHETPSKALIDEASKKVYEYDEYRIENGCIYLFCEKGMGKSKFNAKYFERKLNTFATARNYNTMLKLIAMSEVN